MERTAIAWLIATAAIMLGMPGAARIMDIDAFLVLVLLEFFIIGPLWSLGTGIFSGWNHRARWWLTVANPLLFIAGSWIFLEMCETDFLFYAFSYLMVGLLSMFATAVIRKSRAQK